MPNLDKLDIATVEDTGGPARGARKRDDLSPQSAKSGLPLGQHSHGDAAEKLVSDHINTGVGKDEPRRRPRNGIGPHRPYLDNAFLDTARQFPMSDNAAPNDGTHDVNEKVIAEAYRRGLRVTFGHKRTR